MKRADLSTLELCQAIAEHGVSAWEHLIICFPPKVVLAAIDRDTDRGCLNWGVSPRRAFLTDAGHQLLNTHKAELEELASTIRMAMAPFDCPYCHEPTRAISVEQVDPIHCYWTNSDDVEVIPERLYATCDPCGHRTYEETPGVWVLAECKLSDIGRHVWRDDWRRIFPVEEYCGACGERRVKEAVGK